MATFKVDGARMGGIYRAHRTQLPKAVRAGLREGAEHGRTILKTKTPVDLGIMRNAWVVKDQPYGASLDNTAPHAGIIEAGARPHPVSAEGQKAILDWIVRNRKVARRELEEGEDAVRLQGELHRILNAILWKIRTKGQAGKFIVRNNIPLLSKLAERAVKDAVRRELEEPPR